MTKATIRTMAGALAAAAMLAGCAATQPMQAQASRQRVVLQVSDGEPGKWNLALNNARNIQADLGGANVDIEIVAYGPGIGMIKAGSPVAQRIDEATMSGMKVVACENTMHAQKLTKADMLSSIGYVPAGVVEIMQRQREGWAYIKP